MGTGTSTVWCSRISLAQVDDLFVVRHQRGLAPRTGLPADRNLAETVEYEGPSRDDARTRFAAFVARQHRRGYRIVTDPTARTKPIIHDTSCLCVIGVG